MFGDEKYIHGVSSFSLCKNTLNCSYRSNEMSPLVTRGSRPLEHRSVNIAKCRELSMLPGVLMCVWCDGGGGGGSEQ